MFPIFCPGLYFYLFVVLIEGFFFQGFPGVMGSKIPNDLLEIIRGQMRSNTSKRLIFDGRSFPLSFLHIGPSLPIFSKNLGQLTHPPIFIRMVPVVPNPGWGGGWEGFQILRAFPILRPRCQIQGAKSDYDCLLSN